MRVLGEEEWHQRALLPMDLPLAVVEVQQVGHQCNQDIHL